MSYEKSLSICSSTFTIVDGPFLLIESLQEASPASELLNLQAPLLTNSVEKNGLLTCRKQPASGRMRHLPYLFIIQKIIQPGRNAPHSPNLNYQDAASDGQGENGYPVRVQRNGHFGYSLFSAWTILIVLPEACFLW